MRDFKVGDLVVGVMGDNSIEQGRVSWLGVNLLKINGRIFNKEDVVPVKYSDQHEPCCGFKKMMMDL